MTLDEKLDDVLSNVKGLSKRYDDAVRELNKVQQENAALRKHIEFLNYYPIDIDIPTKNSKFLSIFRLLFVFRSTINFYLQSTNKWSVRLKQDNDDAEFLTVSLQFSGRKKH